MEKMKIEKKLDVFLYLLLRDECTAGAVETIMQYVENSYKSDTRDIILSNGYLGQYAQNLRKRLEGDLKDEK
jgi:hypothetical protein